MSDSLDSFFNATNQDTSNKEQNDSVDLETEFEKLLKDFINKEDTQALESIINDPANSEFKIAKSSQEEDSYSILDKIANTTIKTVENLSDLDSFLTPSQESDGLDGFLTPPQESDGLDSFISAPSEKKETKPASSDGTNGGLKKEEAALARAVVNFSDGIKYISTKKNIKIPQTDYSEDMLKPNYKPSVGKKIAQYLIDGWEVLNKYDPESMKKLKKNANDIEFVEFATGLSDQDMQMAIVSYVEILVDIGACEKKYEEMKEIIRKNRAKKELYEEYQILNEKRIKLIEKLKSQKFPIDVDKLINNYFKAAQKDPEGAFEALIKNPAMYTPIQFDKMKSRFFGLIKVTPEDGIKMNRKIGDFIKNLKV